MKAMNDEDDMTGLPAGSAVITALRRIIRATDMDAKKLARETGLTVSQLLVLELLSGQDGLTPGQLARTLGLAHATVTNVLDRLEARGLIARRRDAGDRRVVLVGLTAAGARCLARAPSPLQERFLSRFTQLADWEKSAILSALQRVAHLMDAANLDAAPVLDIGAIDRPPGKHETS